MDFQTAWSTIPQIKWALIVTGIVILVAGMSKWSGHNGPRYSRGFMQQVENLVNQATKWHLTAKQDQNPMVAMMHADFALAYITAARKLLPDHDIERITSVKVAELQTFLESDQQQAMERILYTCPYLKPEGVYSVGRSAWTS